MDDEEPEGMYSLVGTPDDPQLSEEELSDEDRDVDIGELFVQAGFKGGSPETLKELALFVLTDKVNQQGPVAAMGELMQRFREERISIPDSYIGISRVLITLGGFLMSYQVPFDWTPPEQRQAQST